MTQSFLIDWRAAGSEIFGKSFPVVRVQKPRLVQSGLTPAEDLGPAALAQQAQDAFKAAEDRAIETANAKMADLRKLHIDSLRHKLGADCEIREVVVGNRIEIYARKAVQ